MNEYHERQAEEIKKSQNKTSKSIPKGPAIDRPTYNVKARK